MKYLKLIRLENLIVMAIIQYLIRYSLLIPLYGNSNVLGELDFALLLIGILMIASGGYVINDYFDIQVDTENEKALVGKIVSRRIALFIHLSLTLSGIIIGFIMANKVGYIGLGTITIIASYLLWEYNLRLKKKGIFRNLIVAILSSLFVCIMPLFEILPKYNFTNSTYTLILIFIYSFFGFICSLINEVIKDFISSEGDKKFQVPSLPNQWGVEKTKEFIKWLSIISVCTTISIVFSAFKTKIFLFIYALIMIVFPFLMLNFWIYKAKTKEDFIKISKLNKFIIGAGIMSIFFFN